MFANKVRACTPYFVAPTQGRQIVAGFTYLQQIAGNTTTKLWLPDDLLTDQIEWAAVRQFDILQETSDFNMEELDVTDIKKSMTYWQDMRAGGYCITMISLGYYTIHDDKDELMILDEKLQQEITQLIQFLYLQEQSQSLSALYNQSISKGEWSCADALPHISMAMGERLLFKPTQQTRNEKTFFNIIDALPAHHIIHDVGIGLTLPESTKENRKSYSYDAEDRAAAFFGAIGTTMGEMIHTFMRSYGDRLTPQKTQWHRHVAHSLVT